MRPFLTIAAILLGALLHFTNCERPAGERPITGSWAPSSPDPNNSAGNPTPSPTPAPTPSPTPGPGPTPAPAPVSFLKLFVNDQEKTISQTLEVNVGDEIRFEAAFSSLFAGSVKTKFSLFVNCLFKKTIQDWSTENRIVTAYKVTSADKSNCTTLNVWVRENGNSDPWPLPTDIQESVILTVN